MNSESKAIKIAGKIKNSISAREYNESVSAVADSKRKKTWKQQKDETQQSRVKFESEQGKFS